MVKNSIVLGGIAAHVELIKQLKAQGYFTILVDFLSNPPAKSVADLHIQESTLDKDKVLEIAKKYNACLVTSGCVDQANITAAYVNEEMGNYTPYSYETALKITNKGYMKAEMIKNGISTAKYYYLDNEIDAKSLDLQYPIIVKPADSNSANGVKKAYTPEEVEYALKDALEISRNHKAIIEEFIEGQEFGAYVYVQDNKAKLLMTNERITTFDGTRNVNKMFGSIMPARIPQKYTQEIEDIATQIANCFNLNNTPLFYQAIFRDGKFYIIEFAPRFGGGLSFYTLPLNTGFNSIGAIISAQRGEKVRIEINEANYITTANHLYAYDSVFDHIEGLEGELFAGTNVKFIPYKTKGDIIDNRSASASRVGGFVIKAKDLEELLDITDHIYKNIKVIDSMGRDVLRRDLNLLTLKV